MSINIPEFKIDNWEDFKELINYLQAIKYHQNEVSYIDTGMGFAPSGLMFRGQRDPKWDLSSTLEREFRNNQLADELTRFDEICKNLLESYKPMFRGRIAEQYLLLDDKFDDELWAFGQHYDLKTPLLDWSYSPLVALYFAFINKKGTETQEAESAEKSYRAVFVLNSAIVTISGFNFNYIFPQIDIGGRINAQKGLFTKNLAREFENINKKYAEAICKMSEKVTSYNMDFSKLESFWKISPIDEKGKFSDTNNNPLNKILIADNLRESVLNFLRSVNIDSFTLFPDTKGLVEQCHLELENQMYALRNPEYL